ncbi:MAG: hypothetical protein ACI4AM_06720, partial [Muribaculaceae bacterium]
PDASGRLMHQADANLQTLRQISKHSANFFTHVHADSGKAGGKARKFSRRFSRFWRREGEFLDYFLRFYYDLPSGMGDDLPSGAGVLTQI